VCLGLGNTIACPAYYYCDGDSTYVFGKICPNGFYGNGLLTGFIAAKNCTACTETNFCTGGRITGQCSAGYICNSEADSPTPTSLALKSAGKAFPCPTGNWCPVGAKDPILCPTGTFTKEAGGRQEADCSICTIGYFCDEKNKLPKECPPGNYCPIGSDEATPCPIGSYNPSSKAGGITSCLPCKGGFTCPVAALGNIMQQASKYKCPNGHYCPEGYKTNPIPCIDGSFYDSLSNNANGTTFVDVYVSTSTFASTIKDC
jgi:hypothetical protein